jgi:hypothetical protein
LKDSKSPWAAYSAATRIDKADELAFQIEASGLGNRIEARPGAWIGREYQFHATRKWRVDFAIMPDKIAIEVEGGGFVAGRHSRGEGLENDCEKYSALAIAGWRLIRVTPRQVKDGRALVWIEEALKSASA